MMNVLCLLISSCVAIADSPRQAQQQSDSRAFWQSIGVNVHLYYDQSPYGNFTAVRDLLLRLGIRHIRDGFEPNRPLVYDAFNDLEAVGIRSCLIVGDPGDDVSALVADIASTMPLSPDCLEGPNEYDRRGGAGWQVKLRAYQEQLYTGVKSNPRLAHLPVLAPSSPGFDSSRIADSSNIHPYPGGKKPNNDLDYNLEIAKAQVAGGPIFATETGYHNAVGGDSSQPGVTEAQAGAYVPRLFAEYFAKGIQRTYHYELIDQGPGSSVSQEDRFGLVRRDLSPKPASTKLAKLIDAIRDDREATDTPPLDFTIIGAPSDIVSLPLRKSDGTYVLLLWRNQSVRPDGTSDFAPAVLRLTRPAQVEVIPLDGSASVSVVSDTVPVQLNGSLTMVGVSAS